jgi:hypothetical protein
MSTLIGGVGCSINIPYKIANSKVLAHLGFKSKVLLGPLNVISACIAQAFN